MNQLDDIALARQAMLKKARGAVRAHYATLADAHLNKLLPALEREFNANVQRGILPDPEALLIISGAEDVE